MQTFYAANDVPVYVRTLYGAMQHTLGRLTPGARLRWR